MYTGNEGDLDQALFMCLLDSRFRCRALSVVKFSRPPLLAEGVRSFDHAVFDYNSRDRYDRIIHVVVQTRWKHLYYHMHGVRLMLSTGNLKRPEIANSCASLSSTHSNISGSSRGVIRQTDPCKTAPVQENVHPNAMVC